MTFPYVDLSALGLVSHRRNLYYEYAFRHVSHHVMACAFGRYAYSCTLEYHDHIWKVFACVLVNYVSMDMCIRILRLSGQHYAQCRHQS